MVILGDYHTHTIYSGGFFNVKHATGTILENAMTAKEKGLKQIAITEHGFSHKLYGVKRKNIDKMRKEIEEAKLKTGVDILLGIEANFISSDGDVDLKDEDIKKLDFIIVGFHTFAKAKNIVEFFKFRLPNMLHFHRKKDIKRNTLAVMKAMDKYPIDLISHPGSRMPIDFEAVGKHAVKTNTHLELNGRRICYKKEDIKKLVDMGVKFLANSDAHSAKNVGEVNKGINFAIKYNIPQSKIMNLEKFPQFKNYRKEENWVFQEI